MAYMRYPGIVLGVDEDPAPEVLAYLAEQLGLSADVWNSYGTRAETRREHVLELQTVPGFTSFTLENHHTAIEALTQSAMVSDRGFVLAEELVESLRLRRILLPSLLVVEKICAEAITRGNRAVYAALTEGLGLDQRRSLDGLLRVAPGESTSPLVWLRQSQGRPNSKQMREHLDRLRAWRDLGLPADVRFRVHQNRLLKLAKEGAHMSATDLGVEDHSAEN